MRGLSATLEAAQKSGNYTPFIQVVLNLGAVTYTYTTVDRLIGITHDQQPYDDKASIVLDNRDQVLTALDLKGYKARVSYGISVGGTDYSSECSPLWVMTQDFQSEPGALTCILECVGVPNRLAEDHASATYVPTTSNTETVKDLIETILAATLACFNHCTAYTTVWESQDTLADVFQPQDSFRVWLNGSRLAAVRRLLDHTGVCMKFTSNAGTPEIHFFVPATTGAPTWARPTGGSGTGWGDVAKAYDADEDTYSYYVSLGPATGTLTLTKASALWNRIKLKVYGDFATPGSTVTMAVSTYDPNAAAWSSRGSATLTATATWYEYTFSTPSYVSQVKIEVTGNDISSWSADVYDVQLGLDYDYEYSLADDDHKFFSKALRNTAVIPNHITVQSQVGDSPAYSGVAQDAASTALFGTVKQFVAARLPSDAQAATIAEAILAKYQMWAKAGSGDFPMNCGAEVYDYVLVTDVREGDTREGNMGTLKRTYGKNKYRMGFTFGGWLSLRKFLQDLNTSGDVVAPKELSLERLYVKNLYAENIIASQIDMTSVTVDTIGEGTTYKKVLSTHIEAGKIKLIDATVVDATFTLDKIPDGTTYERIRATDISGGHIKLTDAVVIDGEWYDESGVEIDAATGINLYGTNNCLTTRATKAGTIQCAVNSSGQITAGAGAVILDADGIRIDDDAGAGSSANFRVYKTGDLVGAIYGLAGSVFTVYSAGNINLNCTHLIPDNSSDLGSSGNKFRDLHLSGALYVPHTSAAGSYALSTIYQNAADKILFMWLRCSDAAATWAVRVDIGTSSPPGTAIGTLGGLTGVSDDIAFMVPQGYYFRLVILLGTPVVNSQNFATLG